MVLVASQATPESETVVLRKSRSRGYLAIWPLAALMALTGCSDNRPVVGPESAADVRPAARESVTGATSLPTSDGLVPIAARVHDACGIDGVGTQPADYTRTYRCGIGSVALFSVAGTTAREAADLLDSALSSNQCSSTGSVSSNSSLVDAVDAAQAIEAFYECAPGGVNVHFGLADDPEIKATLPYLPSVPAGTDVEIEPAIALEQLDGAAEGGSKYVAVLEVSENYFESDVCDALHVCP